jgi:hypothetical protein
MAVLSDSDRAAVMGDFAALPGLELTKADLRAALNGLDDFVSTNQTAINNAIPQPARSALTTSQKARLLMYVVQKRYVAGI